MRLVVTTVALYSVLFWNAGVHAEVCRTEGCFRLAGILHRTMNLTANPCDNFHQFTCGKYIKETVIPADKGYTSLSEEVRANISALLLKELQQKTLEGQLPVFEKSKIYFESCMDIDSIEKIGLSEIKEDLKKYGEFPLLSDHWDDSTFNWMDLLRKISQDGQVYDMIISVDIDYNTRDVNQALIEIAPPDFLIDKYFLADGIDHPAVQAYYDVLVGIAAELGANREKAKTEILKTLQFEIELAKISILEDDVDEKSRFVLSTVSEVQNKYQSLDWLHLLNSVLDEYVNITGKDLVELDTPGFSEKLGSRIAKTEKRVLASYIMLRVVMANVPFLNQRLQDIYQKQTSATEKTTSLSNRQNQCLSHVQYTNRRQIIPITAAGYVHKYFTECMKKNAEAAILPYKKSLMELVDKLSWMDDITKKRTLKKIELTDIVVGYPDELRNGKYLAEYFKMLRLNKSGFYRNAKNIRRFKRYSNTKLLRKPYDVRNWLYQDLVGTMYPTSFYNPSANLIGIFSGILTSFIYNVQRPLYMNTALLATTAGFSFAQVLTDTEGQFDEKGNLNEMWDDNTINAFAKKKQAVQAEYSSYLLRDLNITLNAAPKIQVIMADDGGYNIAYKAFEEILANQPDPPRLVDFEDFSAPQLFWILNGAKMCSKMKLDLLKETTEYDKFPPKALRLNGPLRNNDNFAQAFGCPVGSYMNPKNKFTVWE